jgi:hypothetical protein
LGCRQSRIIPSRGDRIAIRRAGISRTGLVWYADQLQLLVKWDDGKSSSLRIGHVAFDLVAEDPQAPARDRSHEPSTLDAQESMGDAGESVGVRETAQGMNGDAARPSQGSQGSTALDEGHSRTLAQGSYRVSSSNRTRFFE